MPLDERKNLFSYIASASNLNYSIDKMLMHITVLFTQAIKP